MKNTTVSTCAALAAFGLATGGLASGALAQGLNPVSDVRTIEAGEATAEQMPERIIVEVPTLDRLNPFQSFAIDPAQRQDVQGRFEIRVDGTIRNYARATNSFVRAHRYIAERLEEARQAWLLEFGYVGGVVTVEGEDAEDSRTAIEPRATIRMPEGASGGGGFRVQAPGADRQQLVAAMNRLRAHRQAAQSEAASQAQTRVAQAQ